MTEKEFYDLEKKVLLVAYAALGLSTVNLLLLMTMLMMVMK